VILVILTQLCGVAVVKADHAWSPIVQGHPIVPPRIPTGHLQFVSSSTPPSIPSTLYLNPSTAGAGAVWFPPRRRRRRRRRRYWRDRPYYRRSSERPQARYRSFDVAPSFRSFDDYGASNYRSYNSHNYYYQSPQFRQVRSRPLPKKYYKGSPRSIDDNEVEEGRGFVKDVRNLFGAPEHCLEGGQQYSCTFAPVCWLTGGVASQGCESFMYSCCKPPELGRRKVDELEKRGQEWLHQEPECGISRHRQFAKRIIGGEKAKFAELPWQVHIRISSYQCGGVLLNHWHIATAAHCVHRAKLSKITVHLGEYDTKDGEEEPLDSQTYKVDHITIHPEFRYMLTQPDRYDVALLHLDRPVFYQENIIPICLPPLDIPLQGKVGMVAGWGKTDNSFGKTGTNILHKVLVPIIDNEECIKWHEDKNILVQLHSEMFCAGHKKGKMDACLGDSGGPLIIHYNGRWTLIGITSAGFGCAVDKQPGIYHKIGKTTNWILSQIAP